MTHTVIVGGGTAGAVLAARLSEDPRHDVTLIEAGSAQDTPDELRDGASLPAVNPGHWANWGYQGWLQPTTPHVVARGRLLGGSSAINGGYFIRPRAHDFARWADMAGPEWSFECALPLLKKMENDLDYGNQPAHGDSGPIVLRRPAQSGLLASAFTYGATELGFPLEEDKSAQSEVVGVGPVPSNIIDGVRVNAAMAYLHDARQRPNLNIVGETRVLRVRIENGNAVGVETDRGVIDADEVVLAAGSIATPHLLMLSGVGPMDQLENHGIQVVSNIPVGQSFSDHPNLSVGWHATRALADPHERCAFPTALNFDSSGALRHHVDGDLEILLAAKPMDVLLNPSQASAKDLSGDEYSFLVALMAPESRGRMTLVSHDPLSQPRIDYNYLSDDTDKVRMRVGVRTAARLLQTSAFEPLFGGFASLSDAILADDSLLDDWITAHLSTAIHLSGSAPMGAVVDWQGRVHGVDSLRVADSSLLPTVPSRGTFAVSVFIGEFIAHHMLHSGSN